LTTQDLSGVPQPGSDAWLLDPSAWYKLMRTNSPVFQDPRGSWQVFRFPDVEKVLMSFSAYSSQFGYNQVADEGITMESSEALIMGSMVTVDPPYHTKLRNIVSKSFFPKAMEAIEPRVKEIAAQFLTSMDESTKRTGSADFVTEFTEPLPVTVIAEMLGIPAKDRLKFKHWSDVQIGSSGVSRAEQKQATMELARYLEAIIVERQKNPKEDLISAISTSEVDGQRLTTQEMMSFCVLLLVAGNETTTNLLGYAIRTFAKYGTMKELHDNPAMIPGAIEEVLRFASPVRAMVRISLKDSELSGHKIPAGQTIMAWIGSANRDEAKFPDPDRFDIARKPNLHIAFGHGIHYCLGAPLARLESKVALQLLAERYSGVKIAVPDERLVPLKNDIVGGVRHLPVEFIA
jgi:cytochrome P450